MRISGRTAALVAGLAFVAAPAARSYPISPVPLWSLVERAETIAYAEVLQVTENSACPREDRTKFMKCAFTASDIASLRILETWKGPAKGEIRVPFPANLTCPAPPRYVKGEEVVAFLARDRNEWTTVGLSYGTLYPEGRQELADLRTMVARAVALQGKGRIGNEDRIDWVVEAASRPGTRWHGLYELEPEGDEVHYFYDREGRRQGFSLSPAQRERIARSFVANPPLDRTLPMALKVLAGHRSAQVDQTTAAAIEGLMGRTRLPYWLPAVLELALERFGDRKAVHRVDAIRKGCCDFDEAGARTLWRTAQRELGIPNAVPLQPPLRRKVRGVGGDTPD